MTDRVFQDDRVWEVSDRNSSVEVYVFDTKTSDRDQGEVEITSREEAGYDSQYVTFLITAKEATLLKEFLIQKGY
jgi:hypothetical protein